MQDEIAARRTTATAPVSGAGGAEPEHIIDQLLALVKRLSTASSSPGETPVDQPTAQDIDATMGWNMPDVQDDAWLANLKVGVRALVQGHASRGSRMHLLAAIDEAVRRLTDLEARCLTLSREREQLTKQVQELQARVDGLS
jgi:hypothetical protein